MPIGRLSVHCEWMTMPTEWLSVPTDLASGCEQVFERKTMKAVESPALYIILKDVSANRLSVWQTIAGQIQHCLNG